MPVAAIYGTKHYAIQSDHLNTLRRLIQSDGQVAWQWAYSAFGEEKPTIAKNRFANTDLNQSFGSTSVAAVTFNLRYPGQYFDQESGLHYHYHRSYSATVGRYTQSDPIGLDGGWNRFGYSKQNPLSFTDPTGKVAWNGQLDGFSITNGGGGAGALFSYRLTSDCVRGQRFIVTGTVTGASMSLGWKLGANSSMVTFEDGIQGYINPYIFNGKFEMVSAGGAFGVGFGWNAINLGGAHSAGSWSFYNGRELSFGGTSGVSTVSSVKHESCMCER